MRNLIGRPVIIVSGGQGDDEWISEAEAMAGYLMEKEGWRPIFSSKINLAHLEDHIQ